MNTKYLYDLISKGIDGQDWEIIKEVQSELSRDLFLQQHPDDTSYDPEERDQEINYGVDDTDKEVSDWEDGDEYFVNEQAVKKLQEIYNRFK